MTSVVPAAAGEVLSSAQERMWLHAALSPDDTAYHLPLRVDIAGALDPVALRAALTEVFRRHDVLRTRYIVRRGRPHPVTDSPGPVELPLVDLAGLPAEVRHDAVHRLSEVAALRRFDLTRGPVLRVLLVRESPVRHSLLVTRHHIASDGWSLGILLRELGECYAAYRAGRMHGLAPLPVQFADFAAWQRASAASASREASLGRWTARLSGATSDVDIVRALDPDAPPTSTRSVHLRIEPELAARVRAGARAARTTTFTLLVTAFGWAVAGGSDRPDLVVGTPAAGRPRRELEQLIGCFATMLPLRLEYARRRSFEDNVRAAHVVLMEALDNQDVPLERIIERLRPARTPHDNPMFVISFTMQNTPSPDIELSGLVARAAPMIPVGPKFALAATVNERDGGFDVELEYDPRRVSHATAGHVLTVMRETLAAGTATPQTPLRDIGRASNPVHADHSPVASPTACLHTLVETVAARQPDAIAASHDGSQLSYRALDQRARRLAAVLSAHGVGPESLVALCVEPSLDLLVGALGILRAGAGYLPLDPADPPARRDRICVDAGVRLAVTRPGLLGADIGQVHLDAGAPVDADPPPPVLRAPRACPDNVAYTIYTSGSTGAPKGVVVTHANLAGVVAGVRTVLPELGPEDAWSLTHSPGFDVSVFEMWGALLTGGRLLIAPTGLARTPDELWRLLVQERVSILSQTPNAFHQLSSIARRAGSTGALRMVLLAGEACDVARLKDWLARDADAPTMVNLYGITETTVHATVRPLDAADVDVPVSPLGRAIPGQSVEVLDPDGRPVPPGGQGELYVGGVGVARGYLDRPGLTALRFLPDDRSGVPGVRRYRSGDVARLLPNGEPAYLGRRDSQVKLRGYRIEPAEIESVLGTHPDVAAVAVVLRTAAHRSFLIGYVVASDTTVTEDQLRAFLAQRLPRHMVPSRLILIKALPLTRNGKVDRVALAAAPVTPDRTADATARTATEKVLADILAELLGYLSPDAIGVRDNLFAIGGDSLVVTQLHARIVETFQVDPPVRRIYQAIDLASLAATVDELCADQHSAAVRAALAELAREET
ncbi:non-ribosomal peptide synthetase [Micromonospora lutea]|uniref:Carrier domain-containing protein n=1 Tax=Micromonospora lutea TaxID=419825 RepID=A0ABQ4IT02_9ACTN|nr:non-ribosomal peptide synthetase [Micromonospora lutea]GIJ21057.1 hypothetical protein Vlu01_16810 [Micromonospora lutea]